MASNQTSPKRLKSENTELQDNTKTDTLENEDHSFDSEEEFVIKNSQEYSKQRQVEYELFKNVGFRLNYECEHDTFIGLEENENQTILFDLDSLKNNETSPLPLKKDNYSDEWNENHVKLPFSSFNLDDKNKSKWKIIHSSLTKLSKIIVQQPESELIEEIEGERAEKVLKDLIPKIIKLALDLPNQICKPIPILKSDKSHSISLTQQQCACILANAFFCTFPDRTYHTNPESLPYINFDGLYSQLRNIKNVDRAKIEKIKCILHYFRRVTDKMPQGVLTFRRVCFNEQIGLLDSKKPFREPQILLDGTIEDCSGALQLDFANKYLGGGVLNHGSVQEEIRFVICPELMVSMLFTECLNSNEAVLIRGCERFSSYTGYSRSFEWANNFEDKTPRDKFKRIYTDILAIDALNYRFYKTQFTKSKIDREITKCFAGFNARNSDKSDKLDYPLIASGNWGCGAFGGDRLLKFLIQLIAACESERDLVYYTFNHQETVDNLNLIVSIIKENKLNVGDIYKMIIEYANEIKDASVSDIKKFTIIEYLKIIYPKKDERF